jgi:hypothetical protein
MEKVNLALLHFWPLGILGILTIGLSKDFWYCHNCFLNVVIVDGTAHHHIKGITKQPNCQQKMVSFVAKKLVNLPLQLPLGLQHLQLCQKICL